MVTSNDQDRSLVLYMSHLWAMCSNSFILSIDSFFVTHSHFLKDLVFHNWSSFISWLLRTQSFLFFNCCTFKLIHLSITRTWSPITQDLSFIIIFLGLMFIFFLSITPCNGDTTIIVVIDYFPPCCFVVVKVFCFVLWGWRWNHKIDYAFNRRFHGIWY
jgi:hypothetical protein